MKMLSRVRRTLDPYMDIILGLLGFPSIFVGFGEGVYRGQQSRPHKELEDAVEGGKTQKILCAMSHLIE